MTNAEMLKLLLKDEAAGVTSSIVLQIITQKGAPMIAQNMPDYGKFCANYPANCEQCREYISDDRSGLFCLRWEKTFPGKVKCDYIYVFTGCVSSDLVIVKNILLAALTISSFYPES